MPTTVTYSSSVTQVQSRLEKAKQVLEAAKAPDGSVDLIKAKALAGKDKGVSLLVDRVRGDQKLTGLSAKDAQVAFQNLQIALQSAPHRDADGDGRLSNRELPFTYSEDRSDVLLMRAAQPFDVTDQPCTYSLAARLEVEDTLEALATHHAATAEGAEALRWAMRDASTSGWNTVDGPFSDAIKYSETSWKRFLPFVGERHASGKGHLSDAELKKYFRTDDLGAYAAVVKERVNARLLMDYQTKYLTGADLP